MSSIATLALCTDELIARFGDRQYEAELRLAKQEYSDRRGRVFEDDEHWERFTRGLLEWYVVERPWGDTGLAPASLAQRDQEDAHARVVMAALASSQRCLAEILAVRKGEMVVVDLVGGAEFAIREERSLVGLEKGDVVELRLIGFEEQVLLGRTFLFHPAGTAQAIVAIIQKMRAQGASRGDIIDHMAHLRSRSQSYRHVPPLRIYESNGELASP